MRMPTLGNRHVGLPPNVLVVVGHILIPAPPAGNLGNQVRQGYAMEKGEKKGKGVRLGEKKGKGVRLGEYQRKQWY